MEIGIDLDGVIVDIYRKTIEYINSKYDVSYSMEDVIHYNVEAWCKEFTKEDSDAFFLSPSTYTNLLLLPNAIDGLKFLMDYGRIHIITARDFSLLDVTNTWLNNKNIYYNVLAFVDSEVKKDYIKEYKIDVFIDDKYDTCLNAMHVCDNVYTIDYPFNKRFNNPLVTKVNSILEMAEDLSSKGVL